MARETNGVATWDDIYYKFPDTDIVPEPGNKCPTKAQIELYKSPDITVLGNYAANQCVKFENIIGPSKYYLILNPPDFPPDAKEADVLWMKNYTSHLMVYNDFSLKFQISLDLNHPDFDGMLYEYTLNVPSGWIEADILTEVVEAMPTNIQFEIEAELVPYITGSAVLTIFMEGVGNWCKRITLRSNKFPSITEYVTNTEEGYAIGKSTTLNFVGGYEIIDMELAIDFMNVEECPEDEEIDVPDFEIEEPEIKP